jgi:hypothetical protein
LAEALRLRDEPPLLDPDSLDELVDRLREVWAVFFVVFFFATRGTPRTGGA